MEECLKVTFSALVANPKKLLYTVANPARAAEQGEKKRRKKSLAAPLNPPPARAARSEGKKKNGPYLRPEGDPKQTRSHLKDCAAAQPFVTIHEAQSAATSHIYIYLVVYAATDSSMEYN